MEDIKLHSSPGILERKLTMKLGLAMPSVGDIPGDLFGCHLSVAVEFARLAVQNGNEKVCITTPCGIIPHDRARCFCFEAAVQAGVDYLFWIDVDNLIPRGALEKMLNLLLERKVQAVSGFYYRRGYPYTSVWSKKSDKWFFQVQPMEGIHEIDAAGLGCAVVDVKWVVKNMTKPYFICGVAEDGTLVMDDVSFFGQLRQKGGVLLGDASIRCGHLQEREIINDGNVDRLRKVKQELSNDMGPKI